MSQGFAEFLLLVDSQEKLQQVGDFAFGEQMETLHTDFREKSSEQQPFHHTNDEVRVFGQFLDRQSCSYPNHQSSAIL